MSVHVLLFDAGSDSEGIHSLELNGTTVVLKDGDKPLVVSVNSLNDPIDASPVFSGKTLFLRGEKYLYAIAGSN